MIYDGLGAVAIELLNIWVPLGVTNGLFWGHVVIKSEFLVNDIPVFYLKLGVLLFSPVFILLLGQFFSIN